MFFPARAVVSAVTSVIAVAAPATATAAPPNDNYLASTTVSSAQLSSFSTAVDTVGATTQPDLFNPDRDGLPFAGGGVEPTTCASTHYGKTVWWDVSPRSDGELEVQAEATYDVVVAVYEWSATTSKITRRLTCQDDDPTYGEQVVLPKLLKGHKYTIQVGGVDDAGGQAQVALYFTPAPPTLRTASARLRVASALRDRYPDRFRGHSQFTRSCYRLAEHKVGCRVRWRKGAYRYSGTVWFRNDVSDPPAVEWTDARLQRTRVAPKRTPRPAPPPSRDCDPNYSGCLDPDAYDYDCAGGSGDGPRYTGLVRVYGDDHFDLDRDGDGIACDDN